MHLETPISVQLSLCLSINESVSCHVYFHMLHGLTETPETVLKRPVHSVPVFQYSRKRRVEGVLRPVLNALFLLNEYVCTSRMQVVGYEVYVVG